MKLRGTPKTLLLIAFIFVLPILVAQVLLDQGWYKKGYTNKGIFFKEHLTYSHMSMRNPMLGLWQVAYVLPQICQDDCLAQLALMRNSWMALGRKQDRVSLVVFVRPDSDPLIKQQIHNSDLYIWMNTPQEFTRRFHEQQLMIIDPLGKFILHYAGSKPNSESEQIIENRDLMLDLRKLLTFSKAG